MNSSDNECVVCMEQCAELSVLCCNGHRVCEKHYLHRAKAIYEEGRLAFGDDDVQRCFLCRTHINDDKFSKQHFKTLRMVQAYGMLKLMEQKTGIVMPKEWRNQAVKDLLNAHKLNRLEVELFFSRKKEFYLYLYNNEVDYCYHFTSE